MNKKRTYLFPFLLLITLGGLSFFNNINAFFVSDDFALIYSASKINSFSDFIHFEIKYSVLCAFRPLISLSFYIDYKIWHLNPIGYHLTNIIFHSLNSFLVFLISLVLMKSSDEYKNNAQYLSLLAGGIFLVLPCHSESVSWISGRTDLIAAFFCLSSFYLYMLYKQNFKILYLLSSLLLYSLALLSKESVITYPLLLLLYEIHNKIIERDKNYHYFKILKLPFLFFCLLVFYIFVRYKAINDFIGGYGKDSHLNFSILLIFYNIFMDFVRAFLPPIPQKIFLSINKYFPFIKEKIIALFIYYIVIILPVLLLFIKKISFKRIPNFVYFLLLAYIITLLPVININLSLFDRLCERLIYLPTVFVSIVISLLFNSLIKNKKQIISLLICIFLFLETSLYYANSDWKEAGEITKNVIKSTKMIKNVNKLYVINLPSKLNGAVVYMIGFYESFCLFSDIKQIKDLKLISYHITYSINDIVKVTKKGLNSYSVQPLNPGDWFASYAVPLEETFHTDYYDITHFENNRYDIIFKNLNSDDKIMYYSAGVLVPLH